MAHIEKRGPGRWRARYRGPDGKERSRTFPRKVEAQRWVDGVEVAKVRGEWVEPALGKVRVGEYARDWLSTKADVSPRTFINIDGRLRNHMLPFFADMAIASVRPTHVRSWVAGLVGSGLAPATVKGAYLTCSQVFQQAVIDGIIFRSPCLGIDLPRERPREQMHFLSAEEVRTLAISVEDRYRALIFAAAYTGLRAGELCALRLGRLNLLKGTLEVAESMSEVRGRLMVGPTKTGRVRTIVLPRFLAAMLGEHIGRYASDEGYVFTAAEGGPIRHRNFYARHFKPAVDRAGLPTGFRFHDLRHTCAALLIANGQHMEEVKEHLGHSSIRVTSDRYGHLFPKARVALAEGLDATFRRAASSRSAAPPRPTAVRRLGQQSELRTV